MAYESKLADFLNQLATNPGLTADYVANREAVLANADLSEEHKELLRSNDLHGVHAALLKESTGKEIVAIFAIC